MRVLVLTNMYPPHHLGGYELSCRDVVERWRDAGHEVWVLTTTMRLRDVDDPPGERAGGVRRDLEFYWEDHELTSPAPWRRLGIERRNQRSLRETLEAFRPDVVSVWHMGAMSLGLLTTLVGDARTGGPPLAYVVCDDWLVYAPRLDAWMRLFEGRPGLAEAVGRLTGVPTTVPDLGPTGPFCFNSDFVRRRAERESRWSPERSTVVYSGIDPRDFPTAPRDEADWRWRLLCVGRLDERKGVHVAVRALAQLDERATLEILGRGDADYTDELRRLAHELGLADRIGFDVVERSELAERYRAADAFLFPVLWDEPFGLVPAEAMACGTPVIATATGGSAEFLVDEVNCLRVPPGDAEPLADAVERLAGDPELRRRLVENGYATASELDVDRLAESLEAWHLAAAEHFVHGDPPHRESPVARLGVDGPIDRPG